MRKKDPSRELAIAAADLAADGKALDISILELREISSVADYFVVASGRSHIQVESICDRIVEGIRERLGEKPIAVEGLENSQWAVLDYGTVVIHVFQEGVRKLYDLERLWNLAPRWKHGEEPPAAAAGSGEKTGSEKKTAARTAARAATKSGGKSAGSKTAAKTGSKVAGKPAAKKAASKTANAPARKKAAGARSRAAAASGSSELAGTSDPSNVAGTSGPPSIAGTMVPRRRIARA